MVSEEIVTTIPKKVPYVNEIEIKSNNDWR